MARLVLVSSDAPWALRIAEQWASREPTQVVLLDAAAAIARASHPAHGAVASAAAAGVVIAVHSDAIVRRGMTSADLAGGVKTIDLDEVADLIGDATGTVVWL
jgi:intracellular sulfur oxidation DsrE/DsrF family protein